MYSADKAMRACAKKGHRWRSSSTSMEGRWRNEQNSTPKCRSWKMERARRRREAGRSLLGELWRGVESRRRLWGVSWLVGSLSNGGWGCTWIHVMPASRVEGQTHGRRRKAHEEHVGRLPLHFVLRRRLEIGTRSA